MQQDGPMPGEVTAAGRPRGGAPMRMIRLEEVTSTQDEALRRLGAGWSEPFAVTARHQSRGRGRLGRPFESPAGASLALTYAHRSTLPPARRGWFPLAAGLAALTALTEVLGPGVVQAPTPGGTARIGLKWPNDLHTAEGRKLGGILVEGRGERTVLLGIGMNLRGPVLQADGTELPGAAWLEGERGLLAGARAASAERPAAGPGAEGRLGPRLEEALAAALAEELARLESAGGDGVRSGTHGRYTMTCLTLGRAVRIDPLGERDAGGAHPPSLHGTARAIDARGRLVVDLAGGGEMAVDVGDVRHLRPDGTARPATHEATVIEQEEHGT